VITPGSLGALGKATIGVMGEGGIDDDDRTRVDRRRPKRKPKRPTRTARRRA
jgi:hypothetical protein